jgi:DNA-binding FadR family transcriptional regulator
MDGSNRVRRPSLVDEVTAAIEDLIAKEGLQPGKRLPSENSLATRFGVSRPTVRAALRVLTHLDIIEVRAGSGAYVTRQGVTPGTAFAPMSAEEIRHVQELRFMIEHRAAYLAAGRRTDAQCEEIVTAWKASRDAANLDDIRRFVSLDLRFHELMVQIAGNPLMLKIYQDLMPKIEQSVGFLLDLGSISPAQDMHEDLVNAVVQGKPERAALAVEETSYEAIVRMRILANS